MEGWDCWKRESQWLLHKAGPAHCQSSASRMPQSSTFSFLTSTHAAHRLCHAGCPSPKRAAAHQALPRAMACRSPPLLTYLSFILLSSPLILFCPTISTTTVHHQLKACRILQSTALLHHVFHLCTLLLTDVVKISLWHNNSRGTQGMQGFLSRHFCSALWDGSPSSVTPTLQTIAGD